MKHANPYAGLVGPLTPAGLEGLSDAVEERRLRDETGFGTLAEAAEMLRPPPPCPRCGASPAWRDGFGPSGVRRRRCPAYGARFTPLTGTVLEGCRKPLAAWVSFIRLALFAVPPDACAEACRISRHTAWERRHRLSAAGGCQDRIVLRGRVWADEACVSDTDLSKGCGQARRRGLSKQKLCMAVGIDARKEPVAEGATLVHDRERAHDVLVRENSLADESCKADARDPECLEAMELASSLCPWPKRCLWRFTGMDPGSLQSCLNLYVCFFRVKRDDERWPKIARAVRHLPMAEARFRRRGAFPYHLSG